MEEYHHTLARILADYFFMRLIWESSFMALTSQDGKPRQVWLFTDLTVTVGYLLGVLPTVDWTLTIPCPGVGGTCSLRVVC